MDEPIELQAARAGTHVTLSSPEVGWFTAGLARGQVLEAGQDAGVLLALGRVLRLRVPAGVSGRIINAAPERVRAAVGFGDVLYELEPVESGANATRTAMDSSAGAADSRSSLVLRSSQSGRFYHRPAPGEPAFVSAGDEIADGRPVGLIEVMKTFTHVVYRPSAHLPPRVRVKTFVAGDGADVRQGDVLLELEAV